MQGDQPYVKSVVTAQDGIKQELTMSIPAEALTSDGKFRFSKLYDWWVTEGHIAKLQGAELKVLLAIAHFAKKRRDMVCDEPRSEICRQFGVGSEAQVSKAAKVLAKMGLIAITPGHRRRSPKYNIVVPSVSYVTPKDPKRVICDTLEPPNVSYVTPPNRQCIDIENRPIGKNRTLKPIGADAKSISAIAKLIGVDSPIVRYILHHKIEFVWNAYLNTRYLPEVCEIQINNPAGYFLGQLRSLDEGERKRIDLDERIHRDTRFSEWNADLKENFLATKFSR